MSSAVQSPIAAQSPIPYFGRAWKILVERPGQEDPVLTVSQSDWGTEALRCTFSVEQVANVAWWYADLVIYNLNAATEQLLLGANDSGGNNPILRGDIVTIYAGYQFNSSEANNLIFKGTVFQPMWDRENVTDFRIILHCVIGTLDESFMGLAFAAGASQAHIVQQMASQAHLSLDSIDSSLSQKKLSRGKTVFGTASDVVSQVAHGNQMTGWLGPNGINIRSLNFDATHQPDLVFGPPYPPGTTVHPEHADLYTPTLIGTPQQTEQGVSFTVLLDARVKIGSVVQLDLSVIRQLPRILPSLPFMLDQDGMYVVIGLRHYGDTRGNDWYTEVNGLTAQFWPNWMKAQWQA